MKLTAKDFEGVKLKINKKRNGELFINFIPIIDRANKIIEKSPDKYLVFYTKDASPYVKAFDSKARAQRFAKAHEKLNIGLHSDDWVDCIVKGDIIQTYSNWYGENK